MTTVEQKVWRYLKVRPDPFLLFLLTSLLLHGVGLLLVALWNRSLPSSRQETENAPIEFVIVPPQESPDEPSPETQRRAATNSVAKGKVQPEIPSATAEIPSVTDESKNEASAPASNPNQVPQPKVLSSQPTSQESPTSPQVASSPKTQPPVEPKPVPSVPSESKSVEQPQTPPSPVPNQPPLLSESESSPITSPESTPPKEQTSPRETELAKPNPAVSEPELPPVATRLPPKPKPVQPIPQSNQPKPEPKQPPVLPATSTPPSVQKTPAQSGQASLLGGTYSRNIKEDSGSSFFNPQASASREAPNPQGLDARQDVDLGPYFAELKRRVRRNWDPTVPSNNHRAVVAFSLHRDGQITGLRLVQTSGSQRVDRETIEAVQKSAPFAPLPQGYPNESINIEFSFNIYVNRGLFRPNLSPSW